MWCNICTLTSPTHSPLFPYTTLFRSLPERHLAGGDHIRLPGELSLQLCCPFGGPAGPPRGRRSTVARCGLRARGVSGHGRSEEHTSELQSRGQLGCRLLLEITNSII